MSGLQTVFQDQEPVTEDLLTDGETIVSVDASETPDVASSIIQQTAENDESFEVLDSMLESHRALETALSRGDRMAAYMHAKGYAEHAQTLAVRMGLESDLNYQTESLMMSELWQYAVEDNDKFLSKVKDGVARFVKWVLEKIKQLGDVIRRWFSDTKEANAIKRLELIPKEFKEWNNVRIKGANFTYNGTNGRFRSAGEIKSSFNKVKDLFKNYDTYIKELIRIIDKAKIDGKTVSEGAISESIATVVHNLEVGSKDALMGFTFQRTENGKIKWVDGGKEYAEYTMTIDRVELIEALKVIDGIRRIGRGIENNVTILEKKIKSMGDDLAKGHASAATDAERVEWGLLRTAMDLTGNAIGNLFAVFALFDRASSYWAGVGIKLVSANPFTRTEEEDKKDK